VESLNAPCLVSPFAEPASRTWTSLFPGDMPSHPRRLSDPADQLLEGKVDQDRNYFCIAKSSKLRRQSVARLKSTRPVGTGLADGRNWRKPGCSRQFTSTSLTPLNWGGKNTLSSVRAPPRRPPQTILWQRLRKDHWTPAFTLRSVFFCANPSLETIQAGTA